QAAQRRREQVRGLFPGVDHDRVGGRHQHGCRRGPVVEDGGNGRYRHACTPPVCFAHFFCALMSFIVALRRSLVMLAYLLAGSSDLGTIISPEVGHIGRSSCVPTAPFAPSGTRTAVCPPGNTTSRRD